MRKCNHSGKLGRDFFFFNGKRVFCCGLGVFRAIQTTAGEWLYKLHVAHYNSPHPTQTSDWGVLRTQNS